MHGYNVAFIQRSGGGKRGFTASYTERVYKIDTYFADGLASLSTLLLGWLPGLLGKIPFLQVGIPAVLSIYFDLFSSCMQAFIFAMLTMLYIGNAAKTEA